MSNIFSISRFGLLFKKHTVENYRTYLLSLVVLTGIIIILIALMTQMATQHLNINTQVVTFVCLMLFAGTIFTSNIFASLGDKRKAIATLTLPASVFEKFLVSWFYSYLIFQLAFVAIFYLVIWSFLSIQGSSPVMNLFSTSQGVYVAFVLYAFLHAICIYGAIYFKKMHFIKTAFIFFMTVIVIWVVNKAVLTSMIHHQVSNLPFTSVSFEINHQFYNLNPGDTGIHITIGFITLVSLLIWAATYFRLKEKQI